MIKPLPVEKSIIEEIARRYSTPFYLYSEKGIRRTNKEFSDAFSWAPAGFRNYFAVKACPNPYILEILFADGSGVDCSSVPELILADSVGMKETDIFFTSNNTTLLDYNKAGELGAIINMDDITHLKYLKSMKKPDILSFRYNPGRAKKGNEIIGKPEEAKYGLTSEQMFEAYSEAKRFGIKNFGIHTMVASNELNPEYFVETADLLLELLVKASIRCDISISRVNFGGGIGIPYRPEQKKVDLQFVSDSIKSLYDKHIHSNSLVTPTINFECGRLITGPNGVLVTKAINEKHTYKDYIGVDATMADLMRPGMYGAYHHISVLGKQGITPLKTYDIVGSLCENNDKFTIDRKMPPIEIGDLLVIHDAGAHGRAMGFNYNGKLRAGEFLLKEDNSVKKIRRTETLADYFATVEEYPGLKQMSL